MPPKVAQPQRLQLVWKRLWFETNLRQWNSSQTNVAVSRTSALFVVFFCTFKNVDWIPIFEKQQQQQQQQHEKNAHIGATWVYHHDNRGAGSCFATVGKMRPHLFPISSSFPFVHNVLLLPSFISKALFNWSLRFCRLMFEQNSLFISERTTGRNNKKNAFQLEVYGKCRIKV